MSIEKKQTGEIKDIPYVPLRDLVIFPGMVVPLFVGRQKSIFALEESMKKNQEILLIAQKDASVSSPSQDDIYDFGTLGTIIQMLKLPDGTVKAIAEGKGRARIVKHITDFKYYCARVEVIESKFEMTKDIKAAIRSIQMMFQTYLKLNKNIPPEIGVNIQKIADPVHLSHLIAAHLSSIKLSERQAILEEIDIQVMLEKLHTMVLSEIDILQIERKIRNRVKKQMGKTQKEYYLNEQMQAIQRELGEKDDFRNEVEDIARALKKKKGLSPEASKKAKKELKKLQMMPPMSAEATVVRNYLDWIVDLPWGKKTKDRFDLTEAERILEKDHFGLKKIKQRILEHLAVQSLVNKIKGPILCFVGPPGTGKTSLGKSVARATGRKFVRLSLGGIRDEAEIRGHRRTYIGAMPGKIIQSLKKVGSGNPVFLLDEVDKMSMDFRGDPASALLEVLDPEQNCFFEDHFMDIEYDLSDVMFITTANTLSGIPLPLQDRMEIIELSSYTQYEKLNIAKNYLVERLKKENGLKKENFKITDDAIMTLIDYYTREAGVRNLEREISSICRKVATKVVKEGRDIEIVVDSKDVHGYLGVHKYSIGVREKTGKVGLVNGLAVTSTGGDLLSAEVTVLPGKQKLILTGRIGDVMQESAKAALSCLRSRTKELGLEKDFYENIDLHIHFPEGAVPKDGPSAGITATTCMASALIKSPVSSSLAMTGEITLRGRVLPVGGIKEKIIAAHRGKIEKILIPAKNEKDIHEVPQNVLDAVELVMVDTIDDVFFEAFDDSTIKDNFKPPRTCKRYISGKIQP